MRVACLLVLAALSGCAVNGFEKFYSPSRGAENLSANPFYVAPPKVPKVYAHSTDVEADAKHLQEEGYVLIGTSSFFGPSTTGTQAGAISQGEKVGAALIMLKSAYRDTLTGTMPLVLPNAPQVATVNTSGTVYGNGGSGSYNATSTVTMPGGTTTYNIPYAVTRSDFFASYWVALDPAKMPFGTSSVPLPDEVRNSLKRNTGVFVKVVIRGTPAFRANILEGDVIVKINDADVVDRPGFMAQCTQYAGQTVDVSIIRDGQLVVIRVRLNPSAI
jgi:hypothetical protein